MEMMNAERMEQRREREKLVDQQQRERMMVPYRMHDKEHARLAMAPVYVSRMVSARNADLARKRGDDNMKTEALKYESMREHEDWMNEQEYRRMKTPAVSAAGAARAERSALRVARGRVREPQAAPGHPAEAGQGGARSQASPDACRAVRLGCGVLRYQWLRPRAAGQPLRLVLPTATSDSFLVEVSATLDCGWEERGRRRCGQSGLYNPCGVCPRRRTPDGETEHGTARGDGFAFGAPRLVRFAPSQFGWCLAWWRAGRV
eukprot:4947198-Prymnesium_polylepis.1